MSDKPKNSPPLMELCALWHNVSEAGNDYLSGKLNHNTKVLVFPNRYKEHDKQPDFIVYLARIERDPGPSLDEDGTNNHIIKDDVPF